MMAQWTSGSGKSPLFFEYDRAAATWKKPVVIDCLSFDTVEIKASVLTLYCEPDPAKNTPAKELTLKLSTKSKETLKLIFPLTSNQAGSVGYKLQGPLFNWTSLQLTKGPTTTKTLTAESLSKMK